MFVSVFYDWNTFDKYCDLLKVIHLENVCKTTSAICKICGPLVH